MYSTLPSNKKPLFGKKREKLIYQIYKLMKTKQIPNQETKQTATQTVTVHESKHFPFQVIEITIDEMESATLPKTNYKIGMCGQFVSEKTFTDKEKAEKYISSRPWELITNMVCVTIKNAIEYEKSQSNS